MPVAIGDSSDDSSSDDEASAEVETQMAVAIGDSSDDEASAPASSTARGQCAMRTWPCPRCYAANLQDRVRFGMLKPEDWSKEKVAQEMRSALQQRKLLPLLKQLVVFSEPHAKWKPDESGREEHKHVVLKMSSTFEHARVGDLLRGKGAHGHFSFSRTGFAPYLAYVLKPGPTKLVKDLDAEPYFWPSHFNMQKALEVIEKVQPAQASRQQNKSQDSECLGFLFCECTHGIEHCDNPKELLDALPSKKRRRTMPNRSG
eukprot:s1279_g3.t1